MIWSWVETLSDHGIYVKTNQPEPVRHLFGKYVKCLWLVSPDWHILYITYYISHKIAYFSSDNLEYKEFRLNVETYPVMLLKSWPWECQSVSLSLTVSHHHWDLFSPAARCPLKLKLARCEDTLLYSTLHCRAGSTPRTRHHPGWLGVVQSSQSLHPTLAMSSTQFPPWALTTNTNWFSSQLHHPSLPPSLPPSVRPPGSCGSFLIPRTVLFLFLLLLLLRSKYWSADPLSPWQSQHYTQETPHLG